MVEQIILLVSLTTFGADTSIIKDTRYIYLDGYVEHNHVYHPDAIEPYLTQFVLWKYEPQYGRHVVKTFFVLKNKPETEYYKKIGTKYHVIVASRQPKRVLIVCQSFLISHTYVDVEREESEKFGTDLRIRNEYEYLDLYKSPPIKDLERLEKSLLTK